MSDENIAGIDTPWTRKDEDALENAFSDMGEMAAIVVIFPVPDVNDLMGIQRVAGPVKALFDGEENVKSYALTRQPAKVIEKIVTPKEDESNWVAHARRELELAGNDKPFNDSILAAVQAFSSYGHSGGSAPFAIQMIYELLQYKNLTPLTDNPKEWMNVSTTMGEECWQSIRRADAFSNDEGKTYYLLEDGSNFVTQKKTYTSQPYTKPEERDGS